MAVELTDSNFEALVLKNSQPAVIDFSAEWCPPCKAMTPLIEAMAKKYDGQVIIGKVDVDTNPELASTYGIRNMPTIVYLKNGKVVDKHVGLATKQTIEGKLTAIL